MEPRFVQCPECGNRYDAARGGFCQRCGANAPAPGSPGASPSPLAPRRDPQRRRVQSGGILLATWGALLAIGCLGFAVLPGAVLGGYLDGVLTTLGDAPMPGGAVHVLVLDNGTAAPGAHVELRTSAGTLLFSNATRGGWANATLGDHAAANLTVRAAGRVLERRVFASANDTLEVRLDAARDPATLDARLGLESFVRLIRIGGAVVGFGALLLLAGGVAALLVRWPALALAGPLPVLALTLLLAVATLSVGLLLILLLQGVGYALVVAGRPAFRRR